MSRLFVDTSIQIQRILGSLAQRVAINRQLTRSDVSAVISQYVWMEYQRSLVADFAHVQRQFVAAGTLRDALAWIASGRYSFRSRSLARCIQIAALALGEQPTGSLILARDTLDIYLSLTLRERFQQRVSFLPDPICCDLVAAGVVRQPDGTYTVADACRKEVAGCRLPEFLAGHQPELRAIADHFARHPNVIKDQPRVEQLLAAVLADPRAALGQAACWPLGDVIIAQQVSPDAALWTLDPDFEPLAETLQIRLYGAEDLDHEVIQASSSL
jgi:hypothetical protein